MKKAFGIVLFSLCVCLKVAAQDNFSIKEKYSVKEADGLFMNGDFDNAIKVYKEVYNKHMTDGYLNSRLGMCFFELGHFQDAIGYFEDVKEGSLKKKDAFYLFGYGASLQGTGDYSGALDKYNSFKQKGKSGDIQYYEVERFIAQCTFAIEAVAKPVSVSFTNLGDSINTIYDDYHPSVSADGKTIIYTSRRSESKGGELLEDGQYFEDIYQASWNEEFETWGDATSVEGALNSDGFDANSSITADGALIYLYRNTDAENSKIISPTGGGDILVSKRGSTGRWGAAKLVEGVNSTSYDGGAVVTADGKTMYFISDRSGVLEGRGAVGGRDIWVAKLQEDGTWGEIKNLGKEINTVGDERAVYIHPNGKTLFFSSEGHDDKNFGGFDIFRTTLGTDGKWSAPENVGYPINTFRDEKEFVLSTDGKVAWISGIREKDKSDFDIYEIDLTHYNVLTGESEQLSILKGKVVDASTGLPINTKISVTDTVTKEVFTFKSNEAGEYFNTLVSNKTYEVSVVYEGYKPFSKTVTITAPVVKKEKRRRTTNRRGKEVKASKNTGTHTVELDLRIERLIPIDVVSKDLFKTQIIAFTKTENGFEINEFSKGILDMYVSQHVRAKDLVFLVEGHFSEADNANESSKILADLVAEYLVSKGVDKNKLKLSYLGDSAPISGNETEAGQSANRRVELRIIL